MYYRRTYRKPFANYTPAPKFITPKTAGLPDDDCLVWLTIYSGQDVFISSLKDQFLKNGGLTEKQWKMADKNYRNSLPKVQLPVLELVTNPMPFMVNRTVAFKEIRDKFKLQYGVFALKALRIHNAGVARNGNRWAEMDVIADADSPVSACRVCGKTLKDHASILTGIGSVCARKYFTNQYKTYKKNPAAFMAPFKLEVAKLGSMKIKVWQNQVTEHVMEFNKMVDTFLDPNRGFTQVAPPVPAQPAKVRITQRANWDGKNDPWTFDKETESYDWAIPEHQYKGIKDSIEASEEFTLIITNTATGNEVEFRCPTVRTHAIIMLGYTDTADAGKKCICLMLSIKK